MYAEEVDRDLITAVIEALGAMQEPSGKWPTTHPIIRPGRVPWYIASSELALSLTWLYFQPALPDQARFSASPHAGEAFSELDPSNISSRRRVPRLVRRQWSRP